METTKQLSQVRRGERVSLTGKVADADAILREDGRVAIPWQGGGGCLTEDQEVRILDEALEALRAIPTLAEAIGAPDWDHLRLFPEYEEAKAATAPHLHANFRTSRAQYQAAHQKAAELAERCALLSERVLEDPVWTAKWREAAQYHRSRIAEAHFS